MINAHHNKVTVFISFQTYGIFYKKSPLNDLLDQATNLILFGSMNFQNKSLKGFLNGYEIDLKGNQTLYELFKEFVLQKGVEIDQKIQYRYLWIDLHPNLTRAEVWAHVLECDDQSLVSFHP